LLGFPIGQFAYGDAIRSFETSEITLLALIYLTLPSPKIGEGSNSRLNKLTHKKNQHVFVSKANIGQGLRFLGGLGFEFSVFGLLSQC
jgi:hypothetical protein